MKKISVMEGYKYHPLCRRIGLNHLCFADDILMFSKGDLNTIILNLAGLKLFTDTTGLEISAAKSEIFCAGMDSLIINRIQELLGFKRGKLPFTYLGVPMSPSKIRPDDCERLVDKMCAKIRTWSLRNLSYAGRLQLVNSVLMSICSTGAKSSFSPRRSSSALLESAGHTYGMAPPQAIRCVRLLGMTYANRRKKVDWVYEV